MAEEGLLSEVSTDILLTENKELGLSGVLFVENVVTFCKKERINIPTLYTLCQVLQSRFVSMRKNMESTINLFLLNITKMKEEINVLELLIQKKEAAEETKNFFNLASLLFVESRIPPQDKCYVKLSPTVIVEMTLEEALKFSQDKLAALTKNEEKIRQQYNYYRDQETILTLNMNRCYAYIQSDLNKSK
ncbi:uncharacterized protein [Blastocystis hominis]|uniref:Uncharacterized protein n=1 Tax=Blastocystis hominis TaxID=12968 RepID=D8LXI5_BLAHO|nr:uncharacterized protein [Blastocystis hominis]CBK20980.2 unnamed protein product [Blastocystis hominis]|eukprot:XP_012895028.1 uncharacterized protein [Blastocystis hominis]